jgi:hypothetical protein
MAAIPAPATFASSATARRAWLRRPPLPRDYPVVAITLFFAALACMMGLRAELPDAALRDMPWLLAVAAVPIIPWLLPFASEHLSQVRAGPVAMSFRDLDERAIAPQMTEIEHAVSLADTSIADMSSRSGDISRGVRKIEAERIDVVAVDLAGARMTLASLYFLAFLLEARTGVHRLVFEERNGRTSAFVGMCSPKALRRSIEREHPVYRDVRKRTPIVDLDSATRSYFGELATDSATSMGEGYSPPVDAALVVQIVGIALERDWIARAELDRTAGLRRILDSDRRYLAVVDDRGSSYGVVDRYRVSLQVARQALSA